MISPISADLDIDIIKQNIRLTEQQNITIASVERLKKRTKSGWVNSPSIKITFQSESLPNRISIFHSFYRVRPYISEPLQCYRCQRLGHKAESCKGKPRCLLCSEQHSTKDCKYKNEDDFKCANCGGSHKANSVKCEIYNKARKIEEIRAKENKTYMQARNTYLSSNYNEDYPALNKQILYADVHHTLHSQAGKYQNNPILKNSTWAGMKRTSTVTSKVVDSSTQTTESVVDNFDKFLSKLKDCLCQLFDSSSYI